MSSRTEPAVVKRERTIFTCDRCGEDDVHNVLDCGICGEDLCKKCCEDGKWLDEDDYAGADDLWVCKVCLDIGAAEYGKITEAYAAYQRLVGEQEELWKEKAQEAKYAREDKKNAEARSKN